jgi:NAD(P)-dependent dehydrogenase (short-subunit alcohol dehydrogenase family)
MLQPDEASKDGYDVTIATNVLSHFLLTRELLPTLEAAAEVRGEARIVCISS